MKNKFLIAISILFLLTSNLFATTVGVEDYGKGEASGVLVNKCDNNINVHYVITCYHVVKQSRLDRNNFVKLWVKVKIENGELRLIADVVAVNESLDLAILKIRATNIPQLSESTKFYLNDDPPEIDTKITHIRFGLDKKNLKVYGKITHTSVTILGQRLDMVDCHIFKGSSGGGIFLEDGRCVGFAKAIRVTRRNSDHSTIAFIIPIRYSKKWLESNGIKIR